MIALLMVLPWIAICLIQIMPTQKFCHWINVDVLCVRRLAFEWLYSRRRANGIELLLIMVLFWSFLPAIAAIPFIGASQVDGLLAAYFEAVSALTTSGGSMLSAPQAGCTDLLAGLIELARWSLDVGICGCGIGAIWHWRDYTYWQPTFATRGKCAAFVALRSAFATYSAGLSSVHSTWCDRFADLRQPSN